MKATTIITRKMKGMMSCLLILCSSILILTGCQKEDLAQLNTTSENTGSSTAKIAQNSDFNVDEITLCHNTIQDPYSPDPAPSVLKYGKYVRYPP